MTQRGLFIVLEGLDRSGKSSQVKRLAEYLNDSGRTAVAMNFPDRTSPTGEIINAYLKQTNDISLESAHLLFSANRWEKAGTIRSLLEKGTSIVCDRYVFSGIAFTVAKGLPFDWCKAPDVGLPGPDAVFFLDVSRDVANARGGFGAERYEKAELQEKVRSAFTQIESGTSTPWYTIDADPPADEVSRDLRARVDALFAAFNGVPIERFH